MEYITIFDEHMHPLGTRSREQAHKEGLWHETFHCWFFREEGTQRFLLFQQRSAQKETFPNLLDVTAAGHLQAGETAEDGVREIKEELGITIPFHHLHSLGITPEVFFLPKIIDREFHHVYLYHYQQSIEQMHVQEAEVAGIVQVEIGAFESLIKRETQTLAASTYTTGENGNLYDSGQKQIQLDGFCPHGTDYYHTLISATRTWTAQ
jgi:isopentenyldiphosphate isomerase